MRLRWSRSFTAAPTGNPLVAIQIPSPVAPSTIWVSSYDLNSLILVLDDVPFVIELAGFADYSRACTLTGDDSVDESFC